MTMSSSDELQQDAGEAEELGFPTREFMRYSETVKERLRNTGEDFDESRFDQAVDLVLVKLAVLAEEGWT
jgi:hypothetical protein